MLSFLFLNIISLLIEHFTNKNEELGYSIFVYARKSRVSKLTVKLELEPRDYSMLNVAERGLLQNTSLNAKSILKNCQTLLKYPVKNYPNSLMGFVTPWNKDGYEVSLRNKNKFNIIVPVWHKVKFDQQLYGYN